MNLNYSYHFFNPNYYHCMRYIQDSDLRYLFFYGGTSSGKTYSVVQAMLQEMLVHGRNVMVFKKTSAEIWTTIYNDFVHIIKHMRLDQYFEIYKRSIRCKNGAEAHFRGVDNPEKLKGLSGYYYIVVDEITSFEADDFLELSSRMRGIEGQKMIATFNPIDEMHWIKQIYYDSLDLKRQSVRIDDNPYSEVTEVLKSGNTIFIKSTHQNNYWCIGAPNGEAWGLVDKQALAEFKLLEKIKPVQYKIRALGEWGRLTGGNEFYKMFDKPEHVGSFDIDEDLPLHISFDENMKPYVPMTVIQTEDEYIRVVDELSAKWPENNVHALIGQFAKRYKAFKNNKIYIYGDATARGRSARNASNENYYDLIKSALRKHGFTNLIYRVPKSNPSVSRSGDFVNRILAGAIPYTLLINDTCEYTILDFMYSIEDKDGTQKKIIGKDPQTGDTFEKYGHHSDTVRYFLNMYLKDEYNEFLGKKSVRRGYDLPNENNGLLF